MNDNKDLQIIKKIALDADSVGIDWASLEATAIGPVLRKMREIPQNPDYHAEGDVYTHTRMVCEALITLDDYAAADSTDRLILFLSALMHDIGKIRATKLHDGVPSSKHHARIGANMCRELLWRELGMCAGGMALREAVANLVRYHTTPLYSISDEDAERRLIRIAANGALVPRFTLRKLCLLARADVLGRLAKDTDEQLLRVGYCRLLAEDIGCIDSPYTFASDYTARAYHRGTTSYRDDCLYPDTTCEIIMLSGLPGVGKDTWIKRYAPDVCEISLDKIREKLHILPTEKQAPVIACAHEMAREHLRRREPFVWNATSLTYLLRSRQISLFEGYGAAVKTVYLECPWQEQLRRNSSRTAEVPVSVIEGMLSRLELPEAYESQSVIWQTS